MHTVFLLGAGFSAPFGLPTMAGFFDHALGLHDLTPDDKDLLRSLRRQTESSYGFIQGDENNIEHVLSLTLAGSPSLEGVDVAARLKGLLRTVYGGFGRSESDAQVVMRLKQFLRFDEIPRDWTFSVVTTNYDVVAEYAFCSLGRPLALPVPYRPASPSSSQLYSHRQGAPALYKLHGSVNWTLVGDELVVEDGMETRFVQRTGDALGAPRICDEQYEHAGPPLIVPPTFFKETPVTLFEDMRRGAWNELAKAERVYIIGYSFPQTDPHMRYFVASALSHNKLCRKIDLFDIDPGNVVTNLTRPPSCIGELLAKRIVRHDGGWNGACPGVFP